MTSVNIVSATTTVVSARPGVLSHVTVNGGTMGTITIYDNASAASGRKVATIDDPLASDVLPYLTSMLYGIVVVTAEATDISVSFS